MTKHKCPYCGGVNCMGFTTGPGKDTVRCRKCEKVFEYDEIIMEIEKLTGVEFED